MKINPAFALALALGTTSMPANAEGQSVVTEPETAVGAPAEPIAPEAITEVNQPTESAQATYIADAAALERGDRSQLLVLGTAHLRFLPKDFNLARFDPLLDRLEDWAPDKIAIERIAGPQCDYLQAYEFIHDGTWDSYCSDPKPAREALGLSGRDAAMEIRKLLAETDVNRPATERRRLAALFLATGDPTSALVQWFRLSESERKAGDGLSGALVEMLEKQSKRMSEDRIIAATLAARLEHDRVYLVDDHSYHSEAQIDDEVYAKEIYQAWDNEWGKRRIPFLKGWDSYIVDDHDANVIEWYRSMNTPEAARLAVANDFGAAVGADLPANSGREYFAYWETRNLRMAANIREVIAGGSRVLAIVGASHKPYYERYLGVTGDLEIVDVLDLLER